MESKLQRAAVMAGATFVGTALPVLPYLIVGRFLATILAIAIALIAIIAISEIRVRVNEVGDGAIAIFGGFDGLTCVLGLIAPIIAANLPVKNLLATAFGLAIAGALSMGAGQYLEDVYGIKRWVAYMQTFILLLLAAGLSALVGIIFNSVG